MQRQAFVVLAAFVLAVTGFVLVPSASTAASTPMIAYTDESGSLYLATAAASGITPLYTDTGAASVQAQGITPDGKSVLVATPEGGGLALVSTGGGSPVAISGTEDATSGSLSADGSTVLFAKSDGIYTVPIGGGTAKQLIVTPDGATDSLPVFSPNGNQIAFAREALDDNSNDVVTLELYTIAGATTKGIATDLLTDPGSGGRINFAPNGQSLVYASGYDNNGIFTVPVTGGSPAQLTQDADLWPSFSPDGTKIFFSRDSSSPGADDLASPPVAPSDNDIEELWSMSSAGGGAAVIQEGDYETLAVSPPPKSTTGTTTGRTTSTGRTTTGSTTTSGTTTTTTTPKGSPGSARSIGLSVSGHHYKVTWTGTARHWKVTLRVGKKTSTVTVKGSVHSHTFTVTAKGAISVKVTATS